MRLIVCAIFFSVFATGCMRTDIYQCHLPFAHPTMTTSSLASNTDARVRATTEGASGEFGGE